MNAASLGQGEASSENDCRLGVLAFGDSITNAGGDVQWGVALHSWALWVARGLGLGYSSYAMDGSVIEAVLGIQIPSFQRCAARPEARYELGCLYIGTNDVRQLDWDASAFAERFETALSFLAARCDRLLTLTIPLDMGRPRPLGRVQEANAAIEAGAAAHGALVVDLRRFGGRSLVMADHVHPTAFGQIAIAEAALDVLEGDGMQVAALPSELIAYETSWRGRLHGDLVYAYRHMKVSARAALAGLLARG